MRLDLQLAVWLYGHSPLPTFEGLDTGPDRYTYDTYVEIHIARRGAFPGRPQEDMRLVAFCPKDMAHNG